MQKESEVGPPSRKSRIPRPPVFRLLVGQSAMLGVLCTLLWLRDEQIAMSCLLGGLVFIVPQAWFSRHAFRYQGAQAAPLIVNSFYRGEAGKFLLTTALFVAVFVVIRSVHAPAFIGTFALMSAVNIALLARFTRV